MTRTITVWSAVIDSGSGETYVHVESDILGVYNALQFHYDCGEECSSLEEVPIWLESQGVRVQIDSHIIEVDV